MEHSKFIDPPKSYREVPFWSWNDALEPEELRRQIALMDEAGWGGFFMHARVGLVTPYLGRTWKECVRACVDEARQRGMHAWLYDEDKWPSGFAGGETVAAEPEARDQMLVCLVRSQPALIHERLGAWVARMKDGTLVDFTPFEEGRELAEDERLVQIYPQTRLLGEEWFNGYTYASLLSPKAIQRFLQNTHEVYAALTPSDLGETVPGIFTDEPCYQFRDFKNPNAPIVPWVNGFAEDFQRRNGYDLLPHLPSIFFNTGEYAAVRIDFWRSLTQRFVETFSRPVGEWCRAHNLQFTGHFMSEDSMLGQIRWIGAAMPHYPEMDQPGIDKLGRTINEQAGTVLTVKQLDSVVCQTGKKRALCENYGCGGQNFSHRGRKWIGDWAYVLGITLNNPHLSLYTMRGERKRDYPQNIFYQQPWWRNNRLIADYFARLSYMLSQGQRAVDVLVLHPMSSAWACYRPDSPFEVQQLDHALNDLLMTLMNAQRDFHLGDELLMAPGGATQATVELEDGNPVLRLGKMAYRVVIVPPGVSLSAHVVRVLRAFAAAGGPVLCLAPVPVRIDGKAAGEPVLPSNARLVNLTTLPGALDELLPFDVRIPGWPEIWVHHRRVDGKEVYFMANTSLERGGPVLVQVRVTGKVELWDPVTGQVQSLPGTHAAGGITTLTIDFAPQGTALVVIDPDVWPEMLPAHRPRTAELPLAESWDLSLLDPNALTLDSAEVRLGEGPWGPSEHILDAHKRVAQAGEGVSFTLRYRFQVDTLPAGPLYLAMETPGAYRLTLNHQPLTEVDGWWLDTSFQRLEITSLVKAGENVFEVSGRFAREMELESVYLVGTFGVSARRLAEEGRLNGEVFERYAPEFRVTGLPERCCSAEFSCSQNNLIDLTRQGLPFYAGRVCLRQQVNLPALGGPVMLELKDLRAAVASVRVNGLECGQVAWQPWTVDLSGALRPGINDLEIELDGTLRNLLGPHHVRGGDAIWTGPSDFRDQQRWTTDYILVPFGLGSVRLVLQLPEA